MLPECETVYEVYAIEFARLERRRSQNFMVPDDHDGPMPMSFYTWVLRSPERTLLVDTGFSEQSEKQRNRPRDRCPIEALRALDIDPDAIEDVILTHLHYDHAGNIEKLGRARFHIQDQEMAFATGRYMAHAPVRHAFCCDDVCELVRKNFSGNVEFHDGDAEIAPGVIALRIGGHTSGLQSVCVHTRRGWVVLTSDAAHYYANILEEAPYSVVFDVGAMLEGHRRIKRLAPSHDHIIPGHDPLVLARYPALSPAHPYIACLHEAPRTQTGVSSQPCAHYVVSTDRPPFWRYNRQHACLKFEQ